MSQIAVSLLNIKDNQLSKFFYRTTMNKNMERISKKPTIGIYIANRKMYSLVFSKQTTLYYKVLEDKNQIDLLFFGTTNKTQVL